MSEIRFTAQLPPDAQSPVKPTKDTNGRLRRYRIWLDAHLEPGQSDEIMDHDGDFEVVLRPKAAVIYGQKAV